MNWITELVKLFLDNTYKINHKLGLFLSVGLVVILIDNHLGFSRHLYNKNTIEEIAQIETLLGKKSTSKEIKPKLIQLENSIIEEKNLISYFLDSFPSLSSFNSSITLLSVDTKSTIIPINRAYPIEYSIFYHIISSCFWLLILLIVFITLIISTLLSKTKGDIVEFLQVTGIVIISGIAISWLLYLIPKFNPPVANYLINFLITTCLFFATLVYLLYRVNTTLTKRLEKFNELIRKK